MSIEEALTLADDPALPETRDRDTANQHSDPDVVQNETLPLAATGFEWQELNPLIDGLADGMASLSIDPASKRYLGSTSGAGLLRSLLLQHNFSAVAHTFDGIRHGTPLFRPSNMIVNFQLGEQLLNHQIVAFLIDSYFANYHPRYPFLHEPSILAAHSDLLPRSLALDWQILFHTILALGAWIMGDDKEVFDDYCYHKAVGHFQQESIFKIGSLPLVQALILLSDYGVQAEQWVEALANDFHSAEV